MTPSLKHRELTSRRLKFCPLSETFISDRYISWLNDPVVCRHNSHGVVPYSREKALNYLQHVQNASDILVYCLVLKDSGEHIGNVSLDHIDWTARRADISILLGQKDCWGKGYGKEAFQTLAAFAFETLGFQKVSAGMSVHNVAMRSIAESLGFVKESVLPGAMVKGDESFDVERWGLLNKGTGTHP